MHIPFFSGTAILNVADARACHWRNTWKENLNVFSLIIPVSFKEQKDDKNDDLQQVLKGERSRG